VLRVVRLGVHACVSEVVVVAVVWCCWDLDQEEVRWSALSINGLAGRESFDRVPRFEWLENRTNEGSNPQTRKVRTCFSYFCLEELVIVGMKKQW
jgi:hypothetical protein